MPLYLKKDPTKRKAKMPSAPATFASVIWHQRTEWPEHTTFETEIKTYLKIRIFGRDQVEDPELVVGGGAEYQPAGILKYVEDLR